VRALLPSVSSQTIFGVVLSEHPVDQQLARPGYHSPNFLGWPRYDGPSELPERSPADAFSIDEGQEDAGGSVLTGTVFLRRANGALVALLLFCPLVADGADLDIPEIGVYLTRLPDGSTKSQLNEWLDASAIGVGAWGLRYTAASIHTSTAAREGRPTDVEIIHGGTAQPPP
jgi:hypothetical protein